MNQHFTHFRQRNAAWLALACLLLALAACSPGGGTTSTGSNPTATSTQPPAPIHVSPGYQGLILVSFSSNTSYEQAKAILEQAGLKLRMLCSGPGPVAVDDTPQPTDQRTSFARTHKLMAAGTPSLTQTMLTQVATSPGVTSIDRVPLVACPEGVQPG